MLENTERHRETRMDKQEQFRCDKYKHRLTRKDAIRQEKREYKQDRDRRRQR